MKIYSPAEINFHSEKENFLSRIFLVLALACALFLNRHLFGFSFPAEHLFFPSHMFDGNLHGLFTHALIHVSWYHFILDASAFAMLFSCIELSFSRRMLSAALCAFASAAAAAFDPAVTVSGLCGLSGASHGLAALSSLLAMKNEKTRKNGTIFFCLSLAKVIWETATGSVFFRSFHLGPIGNPVVLSHAGGFLSGLLCFIIFAGAAAPAFADDKKHKTVIDFHCHVAGLGYGESGCFVSHEMKKNVRFPFFLLYMDVTEKELREKGDSLVVERLSRRIAQSRFVSKAAVLAMDGRVKNGKLDRENTHYYVPNEFVLKETRKYDNLLYGASINPYRRDALVRLEQAKNDGAILVKWLPPIMAIEPSDPALVPFYKKMAELGLPLLTHTGDEASFPSCDNSLSDPLKLVLALENGVTVIAAHVATTGETEGVDNLERLLPLFEKYDNLYADISSLTQVNKISYIPRILSDARLKSRLIYGTDWPLISFPVVVPLAFCTKIPPGQTKDILRARNPWDKDVLLKKALGFPPDAFVRGTDVFLKKEKSAFYKSGKITSSVQEYEYPLCPLKNTAD